MSVSMSTSRKAQASAELALALVRSSVRKLEGYIPGEQPAIPGLIKLNTNENPYPPSPRVLRAVKNAVDVRLRLYPNPTSSALREALAKFHRCSPEQILVGNGSDDVLALITRAMSDPAPEGASPGSSLSSRSVVQFLSPCYSLYPVLARIHGAVPVAVPLAADFSLPSRRALERGGSWRFDAALTFITTPNAPTGRGYATGDLRKLCRLQTGAVVLDETYADFAQENALNLAFDFPHVLVTRTFSKAYSLCFQRVGYAVAHPEIIRALDKIRDSYNVNGLGQVAALATLNDPAYYRRNFERIKRSRARLTRSLERMGFEVLPSQANFLLAKPPSFPAERWLGLLRERNILVRWFKSPEIRDYIRVTVGSEREVSVLIAAVRSILQNHER